MNNKKLLLVSIIMVILIISVLIVGILILNTKNSDTISQQGSTNENVVHNVTDASQFYTVSECVSKYLNELNKKNTKYYGINDNGEYTRIVEESYQQENIYKLLSKEYIKNNNIKVQNIYDYVYDIEQQVMFVPIEMNVLELDNINKYIAHGYILNSKNELLNEVYLLVNLDINNKTFSVEQLNNLYNDINSVQITDNKFSIENQGNNTYKDINITTEEIAKQYLNAYKRIALANPELAYKYLDKEYRIARFGNVENYKKYIEKNKNNILGATISKYKVTNENGYKQYICITDKEDYYIFREKNFMNYSIILDTYTIDIPEYVEKYNSSSEQQKVVYCIDKFIKNVNVENYTLAYSMLSSGFKNNYFKTQAEFEKYAKENFLNKKIEFDTCKAEGDIFICTVKFDKVNERNFNVKLGEGTEFELSFNIN